MIMHGKYIRIILCFSRRKDAMIKPYVKIKLSCWQCKEVFHVPVDAKSEIILSTSGKEEYTFKICSSIDCDFMPLLVRSALQECQGLHRTADVLEKHGMFSLENALNRYEL